MEEKNKFKPLFTESQVNGFITEDEFMNAYVELHKQTINLLHSIIEDKYLDKNGNSIILKRKGIATHVVELKEIIWPNKELDKKEDIRRMTACVLKNVEETIMQDPGQWFWYNKRWILDPIE